MSGRFQIAAAGVDRARARRGRRPRRYAPAGGAIPHRGSDRAGSDLIKWRGTRVSRRDRDRRDQTLRARRWRRLRCCLGRTGTYRPLQAPSATRRGPAPPQRPPGRPRFRPGSRRGCRGCHRRGSWAERGNGWWRRSRRRVRSRRLLPGRVHHRVRIIAVHIRLLSVLVQIAAPPRSSEAWSRPASRPDRGSEEAAEQEPAEGGNGHAIASHVLVAARYAQSRWRPPWMGGGRCAGRGGATGAFRPALRSGATVLSLPTRPPRHRDVETNCHGAVNGMIVCDLRVPDCHLPVVHDQSR